MSFWCKAFKEVNVSSRVISSIPTFKSTSAYMNDAYWITLGNHVDSYLCEWHVTEHLLIRLAKKIRYCQIIVWSIKTPYGKLVSIGFLSWIQIWKWSNIISKCMVEFEQNHYWLCYEALGTKYLTTLCYGVRWVWISACN